MRDFSFREGEMILHRPWGEGIFWLYNWIKSFMKDHSQFQVVSFNMKYLWYLLRFYDKNAKTSEIFFMKAVSEIILPNCAELNRGWGKPQKKVLFFSGSEILSIIDMQLLWTMIKLVCNRFYAVPHRYRVCNTMYNRITT